MLAYRPKRTYERSRIGWEKTVHIKIKYFKTHSKIRYLRAFHYLCTWIDRLIVNNWRNIYWNEQIKVILPWHEICWKHLCNIFIFQLLKVFLCLSTRFFHCLFSVLSVLQSFMLKVLMFLSNYPISQFN